MTNNHSLEQQITSLGLVAPKITPGQVDVLFDQLSFHTYVIPGTTTTIAVAINEQGFEVATASASVAIADDFNGSMGRNTAISNVKAAARTALWKFENYRMKQNLVEANKVGLIAGLSMYAGEALGDRAFVADFAAGLCATRDRCALLDGVASIGANGAVAHHDGAAEKV